MTPGLHATGRMRPGFLLIMAALFAWLSFGLAFGLAQAAQLKSIKVTETAQIPAVQPSWPIPNDPGQVFYLQRSTNKNTIIFRARYDKNGNLLRSDPAHVYWRRYNTTGERKPLKPIERLLAYGVNVKPAGTDGQFYVTLRPLPQMPMLLRQTGPGKAELIGTIGGRKARIVYAYAAVDESGLLPKVTHLTLHGIVQDSGRAITEVFSVNGGSVRY